MVETSGGDATLSKDGTVIQTIPASQATASTVMSHGYEVFFTLNEGVYAPGTYTFTVPSGVIKYGANSNDSNLDGFSISFKILDAEEMVVTPGNGSAASAVDLSQIVIQYGEGVNLQINKLDKIYLTQTQSGTDKQLASYSIKIKGQKITLDCDIDASTLSSLLKKGSAYGNPSLSIPAGTWSVDGVDNEGFSYSYLVSSFTSRNVTLTPGPRSEPYVVDELREIKAHFTTDMDPSKNGDAYVVLQQRKDGKWGIPNGYAKAVNYRIQWTDQNNAVLTPRAQSTSYTQTIDELESGEYRFYFSPNYLYSLKVNNNAYNNLEVGVGSFWLKGATEAAIIKMTPAANSAVRASDWENILFEFSSEMTPDDGEILIKDENGTIVRTLSNSDVDMGTDAHTAQLNVNIARGTEEKVYTVEVPRGFWKQAGGAELPSAAAEFTITVGKFVQLEDTAYPKFAVNPAPSESFSSAKTMKEWVFTYYGADAIELGESLPTFTKDGVSKGGACTVTVDKDADEFPIVRVLFASSEISSSGSTYILSVPEDAWTVSRGEKVYPSKHTLVYKVGAKTTNNTSATLSWKTSLFGGTTYNISIAYAGSTAEQMTAEDAVANFASVPITLNPSNSSIKAGSGTVTLNEMNGNTVVKTIATYVDPSYSGTTGNYTTTGLTAASFTPGKTYAFKIEKSAIVVESVYPSSGLTKGTQTLSADIIQYFQVQEESAIPVERELTLLNTSNGVPRVRLDHLELATDTDNETYGFAISYKKSGMYIGDKDGNIIGVEEEETDSDGNATGRMIVTPDYSFAKTSQKGNVITYSINPSITTEGEYTLVVPAGCFAIDGTDTNKEFVRHFSIRANKPDWSIELYDAVETNTSNNVVGCQEHPMRGFSEIVLTYPEGIKVHVGEGPSATPKLYTVEIKGSGSNAEEVATLVPSTAMSISLHAEGNVAGIVFDPPLTDENTYKLYVPAESFLLLGALGEYVPVDSYTTYFTIKDVTGCEVTPASGSVVLGLPQVALAFNKAAIAKLEPNPETRIAVFDEDGKELSEYKLTAVMDGTTGIVTIDPPITKAGKYRVAVPEGRFLCQASATDTPEPSLPYDLWYTVVDPSVCDIRPASKSILASIDTFTLDFTEAVRSEANDAAAITVQNSAGATLPGYTVNVEQLDDQEYTLTVSPAITQSGTYKIVVPANTFACKRTPDGDARGNEEMIITYIVKNPGRMVAVAVEEGHVILELSEITITYPDAENVVLNDAAAGEITLSHAATEGEEVTTTDVTAVKGAEDNVLIVTLNPAIAVAGTATLSIPADKVVADGQYLPAATAVFDVKGQEYQPEITITLHDSYRYEGHEIGNDAADTRTFNLYLIGDEDEILDMSEVDPNKVGNYVEASLEPLFTPLSEDELKDYDKDNDDMIYEEPEVEILGTRQLNITVKQAGLYKLTLSYGEQTVETEITIVPNFDNPYFHGIDLEQIGGENYKMTVPYDESNPKGHVHWIATGHPTYGNDGDNGIWYKLDYPMAENVPQFASAPAEDSDEWVALDDKGFDVKNAAGQEPEAIHLKVRSNGVTNTKSFVIDSVVTGVNGINADEDVRYIDMQGNSLRNPEKGIYIRITNGHAEKVMIK